jgi:uncharacterized membrane protein
MPIDATVPDSERPVFAALITPHRSLGPEGFRRLMLVCGVVTAGAALRIALLGFWPVSGFLCLDLIGLYIAFKVSNSRARAVEEVVLTSGELLFRQVSHRGETRETRLNPLWTRLDQVVDDEYGMQRLMLVSRGRQIIIARELSPDERAHFARELGQALAQVKRGF